MRILLSYIDPGTGSMVIQSVVGGVVGLVYVGRRQLGRLVGAVRRRPQESETTKQEQPD